MKHFIVIKVAKGIENDGKILQLQFTFIAKIELKNEVLLNLIQTILNC